MVTAEGVGQAVRAAPVPSWTILGIVHSSRWAGPRYQSSDPAVVVSHLFIAQLEGPVNR